MAEFLNKDGVGLMLQNINNHINTKLSNYLPLSDAPKNVSDLVNDANFSPVVSIELNVNLEDSINAGTMLTNVFTADQITAIGNAYGKGIVRLVDTTNAYFDAVFVYYEEVNSWTISGRYIMTDIMANANGQMNFLENTVDTDNFISKSTNYTNYDVASAEGLYDTSGGYPWALPGSDFSNEVGLESTLASANMTPSIYYTNSTSSTIETAIFGDSVPSKQDVGNIVCIRFNSAYSSTQAPIINIGGNDWECDRAIEASSGDMMLFVFTADYIIPIKPYSSRYSDLALRARTLENSPNINGVQFVGSSDINNYATCDTAAATVAKTVTKTGFSLVTGAKISVKFTNSHTAASMTLNVNNTGVKSCLYRNAAIGGGIIVAGGVYDFVYDGTNWQLLGGVVPTSVATLTTTRYINGLGFNGSANRTNYVACGTAAATAAKTASVTGYSLLTGSQVRVKFTYANTASAPTLNITSTGAKSMRYKGVVITGSNFTFDTTKIYTFTYTGTYYDLEGDWGFNLPIINVEYESDSNTLIGNFDNNTVYFGDGLRVSVVSSVDISVNAPQLNINDNEYYISFKNSTLGGVIEANKIYNFILDKTNQEWILEGDYSIPNNSFVNLSCPSGSNLQATISGFLIPGTTIYGIIDSTITTCAANTAHTLSLNGGVTSYPLYLSDGTTVINGCTSENTPELNYIYKIVLSDEKWLVDINNPIYKPDGWDYFECTSDATSMTKVVNIPASCRKEGIKISVNLINGHIANRLYFDSQTTSNLVRFGSSTAYNNLPPGIHDFVYNGDGYWQYAGKNYLINTSGSSYTGALTHGVFTRFTSSLTTLNVSSTSTAVGTEYNFEFTSGSTATTFTYPLAWKWANGTAPTMEANTTYHVSVFNNCAVIAAFPNS